MLFNGGSAGGEGEGGGEGGLELAQNLSCDAASANPPMEKMSNVALSRLFNWYSAPVKSEYKERVVECAAAQGVPPDANISQGPAETNTCKKFNRRRNIFSDFFPKTKRKEKKEEVFFHPAKTFSGSAMRAARTGVSPQEVKVR